MKMIKKLHLKEQLFSAVKHIIHCSLNYAYHWRFLKKVAYLYNDDDGGDNDRRVINCHLATDYYRQMPVKQ